jgi:DNA-binding HxlR family transcriptional regulator
VVLGRTYERENCSAARALELVGERWSLLIIRNAMFAGSTRFTDFQRRLGIAPNILATRLERFVEAGLMEQTRRGPDDSDAREYVLTAQGLGLQPVLVALTEWGDRWLAPDGAPIVYEHRGCGGPVRQHLRCDRCGEEPGPAAVTAQPGPGSSMV